jgi:hypothetical protein
MPLMLAQTTQTRQWPSGDAKIQRTWLRLRNGARNQARPATTGTHADRTPTPQTNNGPAAAIRPTRQRQAATATRSTGG